MRCCGTAVFRGNHFFALKYGPAGPFFILIPQSRAFSCGFLCTIAAFLHQYIQLAANSSINIDPFWLIASILGPEVDKLNNYSEFDHRLENEFTGMSFALFETPRVSLEKINSKGQHR